MIKKANLLMMSLLLLFIAGCSSNPALNRQALSGNKISNIHLQSSKQLESEVGDKAVMSSHSANAGLLGAVIGLGVDSIVNANRRRVITPVVKALGSYNIEAQLAEKLKTLEGNSFNKPISIKEMTDKSALGENDLGISAKTYLEANHRHIVTVSEVQIKPSGSQTTYNSTIREQADIDFGDQKGINATQYLIDNPDKLKSAIEQTLNNTVSKIALDLNN